MPFDASDVRSRIGLGQAANASISAACQGILATRIADTGAAVAPVLRALEDLKRVAGQWLDSAGQLYQADLLHRVLQCGQAFAARAAVIQTAFERADRGAVLAELERMDAAVQAIPPAIAECDEALRTWGRTLRTAQSRLQEQIGRVQAQATALTRHIADIQRVVERLGQEIQHGRRAIAEAAGRRTGGILETVFGALLAPVTGGLSLVLLGVGVHSIQEAQQQIDQMTAHIGQAQNQIAALQRELSAVDAQAATLGALRLPAAMALDDVEAAGTALDDLRLVWSALAGESATLVERLRRAESGSSLAMEHAWFTATRGTWAQVTELVRNLAGPRVECAARAAGPPVIQLRGPF